MTSHHCHDRLAKGNIGCTSAQDAHLYGVGVVETGWKLSWILMAPATPILPRRTRAVLRPAAAAPRLPSLPASRAPEALDEAVRSSAAASAGAMLTTIEHKSTRRPPSGPLEGTATAHTAFAEQSGTCDCRGRGGVAPQAEAPAPPRLALPRIRP